MDAKDIARNIIRSNPLTDNLVTRLRLLKEMFYHYSRFCRNTGQIGMAKNESKYAADLRIRVHAIEKGLSMPNVRVGFSEKKVKDILKHIDYYKRTFKDSTSTMLSEANAILDCYFKFNAAHGHSNQQLRTEHDRVLANVNGGGYEGGTKTAFKEKITEAAAINFKRFAEQRFAIRDFSEEPVSIDLINKALKIAEKTPSACNRQPWRVYVYRGKRKDAILQWQQGCRGFSDSIDTAILVTCDIESYFIHEMNLPYVDGGLYAMTLIYALHSLGLGTIPLTCGLMSRKLKTLYRDFKVRDKEVPVLLIGVGNLKEKFEVTVSSRYDYHLYTTFVE